MTADVNHCPHCQVHHAGYRACGRTQVECPGCAPWEVPDPLPLRTIPVPREVSAVAGCDCGGVEWHRAPDGLNPGCSIWRVDHSVAVAAINDAHARERAFTDSLNARLRAALTALDGDPGWTRVSGDG
jgi:hypothetical protein